MPPLTNLDQTLEEVILLDDEPVNMTDEPDHDVINSVRRVNNFFSDQEALIKEKLQAKAQE